MRRDAAAERAELRANARAMLPLLQLIGGAFALALAPADAASATPDATPATAAPASPAASAALRDTSLGGPDAYLLDATGARALAWVRRENAKTLAVLASDPRFARNDAAALAIGNATDRIPTPDSIGGRIYNFWQDAAHVRGIWRWTTPASYATAAPRWTTALDLDALAARERANWVWEGAQCREPDERRCLVFLSDGGEDAQTVREFDRVAQRFVPNGFVLPRGKQSATWLGDDALLVARAWTPGELTTSGYPYVVKRLARGAPLAAAVEVYRGARTDVSAGPFVLHDAQHRTLALVSRSPSFFETTYAVLGARGARRLALPEKVEPQTLVAGRFVVKLDEPWHAANGTFAAGTLVSVPLANVLRDPAHLAATLVYAPDARASLGDVAATRSRLVVTSYESVRGRAAVYAPVPGGGWRRAPFALPDDASIDVVDTSPASDRAFLDVTSYLTPTRLYAADAATGAVAIVKRLPARFDASRDAVDQHEATSPDGTRVPYFLIHPKTMRDDGTTPTILYGYGGFAVSLTPAYSANVGKLWLERGNAFAVANIRGGGEFGPAWHEAALTVHRQRAYDDFAAVARDLIARGVTSPRRLGIQGGSNGGLLMGVEFTQHPELFHAVDMQVPLLDMLGFERIAAGASWVGEYGTVANVEQRAFLAAISPYANLRPGTGYPEPFIWTTTKDDRVGPQHARVFAAKLAELGIPYLFYEVTEGGHGAGANVAERAKTTALEFTYFERQLTGG